VIRMGDGALRYRASRIEEFIGERERLSAGASPDCAWITGNPDPTEWAGSVRKGPDVSQLENPLIILLQAIPQE
jgi:hypothetical protein